MAGGASAPLEDKGHDFPPNLEEKIKPGGVGSIYNRPPWREWSALPMLGFFFLVLWGYTWGWGQFQKHAWDLLM